MSGNRRERKHPKEWRNKKQSKTNGQFEQTLTAI
jgi:hypothetical protein